MLEVIKGVSIEAPFKFFEEISKIPRPSGKEEKIANYLVDFARKNGLEYYKDSVNNVLIRKCATLGREGDEPIMLQAHTDMVAEKNNATVHDFEKDSIKLVCEGNILRANGTTLGADDGFGVAVMLAVLDNKELSHPELECLFTSSEEVGLVGAGAFDYSLIKSRRMINLDSAEESCIIIGCCGGIRTEMTIPTKRIDCQKSGLKITIGGLCGGHSGEDINKGRLNAHILMGKIIGEISKKTELVISSISGGDKDNAIPRECEAIILPRGDFDISFVEQLAKNELKAKEDGSLFVKIESCEVSSALSKEDTEKILKVLSLRNAVIYMRSKEPILPETSRNLARIRTESDKVTVGFSSRSYLETRLTELTNELDEIAKEIGADTYHHEKYPGWQSEKDSDLVRRWASAYKDVTGNEIEITLIHAGLECGLMSSKLDGLEAISVGCNVHDLHTPKETMEIDSMEKIYKTVTALLKTK